MSASAAVMTGKGTGAISTIQLFGNSAETIIKKIFKPAKSNSVTLKPGLILPGTICDGEEIIDQVTIGCEGQAEFAINCHGNPIIVEMIMKLFQRHGAKLLTADELLIEILESKGHIGTIALEAKLAQANAKTIRGTKIIANQIDTGLTKTAENWLQNTDTMSLKQIKKTAMTILEDSLTAKLIISGCKVVLAGPTNTGKSTLLNYLSGRRKAIVTDIKGTTRDWVSAQCQIDSLSVELIDTAGLDEELAANPENIIEKISQEKSVQILEDADLVLLVLDSSRTTEQIENRLLEKIVGKKVLTVLNKSDLPAKLDTGKLPKILGNPVQISAKFGTGIENLLKKILQITGAADFDLHTTVCFTCRQENLLKQLSNAKSHRNAVSIITELLNGPARV